MSKYTKAYSKLLLKLSEANVLTKEAKIKELKNALLFTKEINAFSRGALVLLSGYLEAYIKDLGELVIDSIVIKSVSRQTINDSFRKK